MEELIYAYLVKIQKERPALNVTNEAKHLSHAPPTSAIGSLTFLIDGGKWARVSKASPTLEAHTCYAGGNTTKRRDAMKVIKLIIMVILAVIVWTVVTLAAMLLFGKIIEGLVS